MKKLLVIEFILAFILVSPAFSAGPVLQHGDRGQSVVVVQQALQAMGFAVSSCDGKFGPETENAVASFQAHAGIPVTGKLDQVTLEALESEAPPSGKKLWEMEHPVGIPDPTVSVAGKKKMVRIVVVKNEHRTFLFSKTGKLIRIFPNATGRDETPTESGLRVVAGKINAKGAIEWGVQSRWKDSHAFGVRILDLWAIDPTTGKRHDVPQKMHGTFDRPSIGLKASHGCIRHRNEDIVCLYENVETGALVLITDAAAPVVSSKTIANE